VRDELRQQKKEKYRRRRLRRSYLTLFLLIVIMTASVWIMRHDRLQITEITVKGNRVVASEVVMGVIEEELGAHYFWIIPKTNLLFYPRSSLKARLAKVSSYIKDIDLSIKELKRLEVSINERKAEYLWCDSLTTTESACYLVDESGLLFSPMTGLSRNLMFIIESDLPANPINRRPLNSVAFSKLVETIRFLPDIFRYAGVNNTEIGMVRLAKGGDYIFTIEESRGTKVLTWELWLNSRLPLSEVAGRFKALWETEEFKTEHLRAGLQYIDLRFGQKIFYRPAGSGPPVDKIPANFTDYNQSGI
jgi:hypothetical protein